MLTNSLKQPSASVAFTFLSFLTLLALTSPAVAKRQALGLKEFPSLRAAAGECGQKAKTQKEFDQETLHYIQAGGRDNIKKAAGCLSEKIRRFGPVSTSETVF